MLTLKRLNYILKAYDENLCLKTNTSIKILNV